MPSVLQPSVFSAGRNMALVGLVIALGAIGAWCYWGHHFWTALKGPTEVTLAELAKIEDPGQLPSTWVKVKFDKYARSEVVLEETSHGVSRVDEAYFIFQAGDRWMVACVPEDFKGNELSGQIWRRGHGLAREAVTAIADELKDVHHGKLFDCEFDATESYATKWQMTTGIIGFFVLAGGFFSCLGLSGMRKGYLPPNPADYGLSPSAYDDLVVETPEDAQAAIAMFIRDAGLNR